ncbi:MAG: phospho-N-acetylmuramoyl-pentapeptide-transferase, phospho-N-acetylmuramoyl-pentapeptide-transferase [Candidatus Gottesmanbacteria bacterium GW2011_GWA2_43_14]|uniref:Phospho-N-acetylmuramoyl-pentapeptide-transferase n=1 Tax=Candidatus Gottesmanbacteria bacterium GW2011_GWA2_43_14 TaxID=1618443 RepID=A0A0G1DLN5_9BACT|nr:MAG: phospho-N-acetylmuramoyl-pentapeptide-transferase, phospho-N-acetylmuramoyl-pentapeptide-transferase [Candidatus Gottesmanbacteria bacterium GW2011_GWA2_43_14]
MGFILGILILSFLLNAVTIIPFINLLYKIKFKRQRQETRDALNKPTPIFDMFHRKKAGTPIGGGFLLIFNTTLIFLLSFPYMYYFWLPVYSVYPNITAELKIMLFGFISFGLIGLYDDIKKIFFGRRDKFFGLRLRHKLLLEIILALLLAFWLYFDLKISIINVPLIGVIDLGIFYILFAAFVIVAFANAYNITDGLDGLATGILLIALIAFWVISGSILDTPMTLFIAIWLGSILAFLYFNVYPARIFLGDVGALSFGATFAVVGLMLGKTFSLIIIGGIFVLEITTSLIQLLSKRYAGKKVMAVAPFHLWLQNRGWHESTIVLRAWLATIVLAIVGLWLAFIT